MLKIKRNNNSRGMAIRHYVFGLIRKSGDASCRLPSSYELAEMFGTTRRVVRYELELLIKEKILISKPRVGTFTNPKRVYLSVTPEQKKMPMIGVIDNDGTRFCYGRAEGRQMGCISLALADRNCYLHPISFATEKDQSRLQELKNIGLDGIIWRLDNNLKMMPYFCESLAEIGIPTVLISDMEYPTLNQVYYATENAENKLLRIFAEKQKNSGNYVIVTNRPADVFADRFLGKMNVPEKRIRRLGMKQTFTATVADFKKLLKTEGAPAMILCNVLYAETFPEILQEYSLEKIPLITNYEVNGLEHFCGYAIVPDAEKAAGKAADLLLELIRYPHVSPMRISVESILTYRGENI